MINVDNMNLISKGIVTITEEIEPVGKIPETCIMEGQFVSTKGKVFAYRGGGYDGCFWEQNYFYIDMKGAYHDIHSSGCDGVFNNILKAEDVIVNQDDWSTDIYDVQTEEGMAQLDKFESIQSVIGIVFFLWFMEKKHGQKIPAWYTCDVCKEKQTELPECVEVSEFLYDFHGCGGIAITAGTKICDDCRQLRRCEDCEEVDTRDPEEYPIVYNEEDHVARCVKCVERKNELNQ